MVYGWGSILSSERSFSGSTQPRGASVREKEGRKHLKCVFGLEAVLKEEVSQLSPGACRTVKRCGSEGLRH